MQEYAWFLLARGVVTNLQSTKRICQFPDFGRQSLAYLVKSNLPRSQISFTTGLKLSSIQLSTSTSARRDPYLLYMSSSTFLSICFSREVRSTDPRLNASIFLPATSSHLFRRFINREFIFRVSSAGSSSRLPLCVGGVSIPCISQSSAES